LLRINRIRQTDELVGKRRMCVPWDVAKYGDIYRIIQASSTSEKQKST